MSTFEHRRFEHCYKCRQMRLFKLIGVEVSRSRSCFARHRDFPIYECRACGHESNLY